MSIEITTNDSKHLQLRHPFTSIISGPTSSGKTVLIRRILKNWKNTIYFNEINEPLNVIWVYGQYQELYNTKIENVNVKYSNNLGLITNDLNELKKMNFKVIIIDDLMDEMGSNEKMSKLFTRGSHHLNLSVIFIVQNFFHQSKLMRTISLNAQYIILLKNFRDKNQIEYLGKQLFGKKSKYFVEIFDDATSKPYGYLIIDLKSDTPNDYRLKSRITEEELLPSLRAKTIFEPNYYKIND